jgi:hypothetical protein
VNNRSTNNRFTHFGGDLWSNVESSHGVSLSGGSTGGIVEPVGDDANITLIVRGKGTGGVQVGNSSSPVTLGAGVSFKGAGSTTFAWAVAALSSGATEEVTLASATADIMPGDVVSIEIGLPAVSTQTLLLMGYRTSTAAASRVTITIGNITSTAVGSSASGTGRISWVDLTA